MPAARTSRIGDNMPTSIVSNANLQTILDTLGKTSANIDLTAAITRIAVLPAEVLTAADLYFISSVGQTFQGQINNVQSDIVRTYLLSSFINALNNWCAQYQGYPTLDAYLANINAAPYTLLASPDLAYLYQLTTGGKVLMTAINVFAPVTRYGTGTVGAGAAIALAGNTAIVTATAGTVQGYMPPGSFKANVTTSINGTLSVTVTGTGFHSNGTAAAAQIWTAVLDNKIAGQSVTFNPSTAGDRLAAITNIAGAGTATAGIFTLDTVIERVIA